MSLNLSAVSLQYVRVPVAAMINDETYDPTGDAVSMAFMASGTPGPSDWKAASWESSRHAYYARCLVGPNGTVTLAAGTYTVWVKITDSPEIPAMVAGQLVIT